MIDFETEFRKTHGQPFEVNGRVYRLMFPLSTGPHSSLVIRFVQADSEWRQGLRLDCNRPLAVKKTKSKAIVLWHDTAPTEVQVACPTNEVINVRNVWDVGDGTEHSWHAGAAMVAEEIGPRRWRLLCNDGHMDDACNDLIVELELG